MKKRIFSRALALFMALSLLSTTAFAASFANLQEAISDTGNSTGKEFTTNSGEIRYGYGDGEGSSWAIEAWNTTGDDGSSTRNVLLNEDVTYKDNCDTDKEYVYIKKQENVTLNLNGNTINGGYDAGTGEGGSGRSLIYVEQYSDLVINGGIGSEDSTRGTLTGGNSNICDWPNYGCGGAINAYGHVTLNNVDVVGNHATFSGGAIAGFAAYDGTITLNNTNVTDNTAGGKGGGIYTASNIIKGAEKHHKLTVNGGSISDNIAKEAGGGVYLDSEYGNGIGGFLNVTGDCNIYSNISGTEASDVYAMRGSTITGVSGLSNAPDGKEFESWHDTLRENEAYTQDGDIERDAVNLVCGLRNAPVVNDADPSGATTPTVDAADAASTAPASDVAATTIADDEVPLAGLLTLADLLEELRQHEEIAEIELPEDFKWIDHELAQAICWGLQEKLVVDTEDDPLDPDELLTVGLMREVLTNYVELYVGLDNFVVELEGEDEDLVMDYVDMISRLGVFYEELEAALEAEAA